MRGRVTALSVIIVLLVGLVLGQAVLIQVHRAAALDAAKGNPRNFVNTADYSRGEILSSNGLVLARSVKLPSGTYQRVYPVGRIASAIVGYVSSIYGTGGIENEYNAFLVSHPQPPRSISQALDPVRSVDQVNLTLEVALQQVASRALNGTDGAVVALNPKSGAVLAMYSNPNFNPAGLSAPSAAIQKASWIRDNKPNAHGFPPLGSVATQERFPPGSTFKIVTTAAVYRYWPGLAQKSYPYRVCTPLPDSNKVLCNSGLSSCGGTIAVMLPASCDPGYADIGLDLGGTTLFDMARQFGYDAIPPLDLGFPSNPVPSFFPTAASFVTNQPGVAYSAIGQQDVSASALQNALVAAGIANRGIVLVPHLLRSIVDPLGNVIARAKNQIWRRPLTAAQANQIVPLMQAVVSGGTASGVGFLSQDDVAAKTGTAQTGNALQNTDDWMIAFAPATDPIIAVAVVVPYQSYSAWGATVAGPIVKCMIEAQLAIAAGQPPAGTGTTCAK